MYANIKRKWEFLTGSNIALSFLFVFTLIYIYKIIDLSSGFIINHYPFITADGFDWITEGTWLLARLTGRNVSNIVLPIARPPLFVLITMLDALAGQRGIVIGIAYGLIFFGTGYFVLKAVGDEIQPLLAIFILVALLFTPVNFARKWILSDAICVFLSFYATYYLFENFAKFSSPWRTLFLSLIIALSGVTQAYGLIAPMAGVGVLFILVLRERNFSLIRSLLICGVLSLAFWALFSFLWYGFIPHDDTPTVFSLLRLSKGMFKFYFYAWGYYFLPFIPLLALGFLVKKKEFFRDRFVISLWLFVAVFMFLALCYQWEDARFTFIFWPFFIAAVFRTYRYVNGRFLACKKILLGISVVLILFQSLFLHTGNEWKPDFRQVSIDPSQTWYAQLFLAGPIDDRFQLQSNCNGADRICGTMVVNDDDYVKKTMNTYVDIAINSRP